MASKSVLFLAVLLVATTALSNALIDINDGLKVTSVATVEVSGSLFCGLTPIPNAIVYLSLDGTQTSVATTVTAENGSFKITLNTEAQLTLNIATATVYVKSPNCALFLGASIIHAPISLVSILGTIATFNTLPFVIV